MVVLTLMQFALVLFVVGYLLVNLLDLIRVEPVLGPLAEMPFVSICVPARNEGRDLEACLASLLEQEYPNFEVIVVDDHSTDDTPQIIESLSARYPSLIAVKGRELPDDWYGKPYALKQAVEMAQGEYLIFTDADPVFEPYALMSAMYWMQVRHLDLLSLMPASIFGSFWEKAVQPLVFALIMAKMRFRKVNSPDFPDAMGVGAFLMVRKTFYERIGGHERLKQAVLEDIGLAREVKKEGGRILIADAKKLFSIRMYHSLQEIWVGWRKNMFLAFKRSIPKTFAYAGIILAFLFTPYLFVIYHGCIGSTWILQCLAWGGLGLSWITAWGLCEELGVEKRMVFVFPFSAWMAGAVMLNSMFFILTKGKTEWRGRSYAHPSK